MNQRRQIQNIGSGSRARLTRVEDKNLTRDDDDDDATTSQAEQTMRPSTTETGKSAVVVMFCATDSLAAFLVLRS